ncbi:MAG: 50S ribosomal protein L9 [Candidatus Delongbacteria bacterium]|jgi:large subunit ribosomal protein L9|nr:50S ribosomal protein L9 [Candidatus Delongbacteria bacterium]
MDIILKKDMPNLGEKDDIVNVKDGYARHYLIPNGMAVIATKSARKMHEENMRQRSHKIEKIRKEAQKQADKFANTKFRIGAKTSSTGKIFGSVNEIILAETLEKEGITVDRKNIKLDDPVKEVGKYKASVKLYKDIEAEFEFEVYSEE